MLKPPEVIATLKDLKLFLNFFVDGSYGLWIGSDGAVNVIVPRKQYRELKRVISDRKTPGSIIHVRSQSLLNELRLLFMRMGYSLGYGSPGLGIWRFVAWVLPIRLVYWCFLRAAIRVSVLEKDRPLGALSAAEIQLLLGAGIDHEEAIKYAQMREWRKQGVL